MAKKTKKSALKPRWFIVVGRRWGDDEATPLKIKAKTSDEARRLYKEEMNGDDEPVGGWAKGDGPGTVWADNVFDCGSRQPKEV
jgi:hypothetical protein